VPTSTYAGAPVRFTRFDTKTKQPVGQYVYQLDAVAAAPKKENGFFINGISEILWVENNQFLVLERSFSEGSFKNTIKIYLADFTDATDVAATEGLHLNKMHRPAVKKLLYNTDNLGTYIDNVEGITFGPLLPNGHRSLILIADNNFKSFERSQVFLFEIIP